VNAISPGHIDTPIFESWQKGEALTKMKEELAKNVPLGRPGDPDEIAKAIAFLASDEASYIAGIEFFVDGGVAQICFAHFQFQIHPESSETFEQLQTIHVQHPNNRGDFDANSSS
jgi:enoyl-[acyl-carrier-protein] reductase (NADH)